MQTLLHVGSGPKNKEQTTRAFNNDSWKEIRLISILLFLQM